MSKEARKWEEFRKEFELIEDGRYSREDLMQMIIEEVNRVAHLRGLLRRVNKAWWLPEICCKDNDEACDDCKLLRELAAAIAGGDDA